VRCGSAALQDKSVAALDIRSDKICAVIAERGVNNTFIIKSKYSLPYDGYAEGEFLDVAGFKSAVREAISSLTSSSRKGLKKLYVGVPCEFVEDIQTDKVISFSSTQKINARHIREIEELSRPEKKKGFSLVGCSPLYYSLSDKRKMLDPLGAVSDSLRARFAFYYCSTAFIKTFRQAADGFDAELVFIPQNYSQAVYLNPAENKNRFSVFFDFGYISSTYFIACGNGVAYSEAFSIGIGHLVLLLSETLDVPFDVAEELAKKVNLNSRERLNASETVIKGGKTYAYPQSRIREILREGLDGVCETLDICRRNFIEKDMGGATVYITGEGVGEIRGAVEHIASRLVAPVEVSAPAVPYYDKPVYSSLFSLLNSALDKNKNR